MRNRTYDLKGGRAIEVSDYLEGSDVKVWNMKGTGEIVSLATEFNSHNYDRFYRVKSANLVLSIEERREEIKLTFIGSSERQISEAKSLLEKKTGVKIGK